MIMIMLMIMIIVMIVLLLVLIIIDDDNTYSDNISDDHLYMSNNALGSSNTAPRIRLRSAISLVGKYLKQIKFSE